MRGSADKPVSTQKGGKAMAVRISWKRFSQMADSRGWTPVQTGECEMFLHPTKGYAKWVWTFKEERRIEAVEPKRKDGD